MWSHIHGGNTMNIGCWFGFHDWFYYDHFNSFDNDRRICRDCGKIESTFMNTSLGYGYDQCGYASKEEKALILNPENQLEIYRNELEELLERKREREEHAKIFNYVPSSRLAIETHTMLVNSESSLIHKYKTKINELSRDTNEKRLTQ